MFQLLGACYVGNLHGKLEICVYEGLASHTGDGGFSHIVCLNIVILQT